MFCKKGVLRHFTKFTGKTCARVSGLSLLKKRHWYRCFPVNFAKFLRTPFHIEHLWWLLLFFKKAIQLVTVVAIEKSVIYSLKVCKYENYYHSWRLVKYISPFWFIKQTFILKLRICSNKLIFYYIKARYLKSFCTPVHYG